MLEKFRDAKAAFPIYAGPPPFKGEALISFESAQDDHESAFAQVCLHPAAAARWRRAVAL